MSVQALYARIAGATCSDHGFSSDAEREAHIAAIVAVVKVAKGIK